MPVYVEIAVNVPRVSGVFHYHLPPELEGAIRPGHLVVAPFGAQTVQGVILRFVDEPEVAETKAVEALLDLEVVLTETQIALAHKIAGQTLAPLAVCVGLMIPVGLSQQVTALYTLLDEPENPDYKLNDTQKRVISLLHKRGPLKGTQLDWSLSRREWRSGVKSLIEQGWIKSQPVLLPPSVRPKYIRTAQLSVPPEMVLAKMEGFGSRPNTQKRRQFILEVLAEESSPVDVSVVYAKLGDRKTAYLNDLRLLHDKGLIMLREEEAWRDPLAGLDYDPSYPPELTSDQKAAWKEIQAGLAAVNKGDSVKPFLLHGVTGSGKTEIYLRAIAETLKAGKQAIYLVPEIALTPQTVRRVMSRFPGRVGLVHSRLSPGEQYDTWRRARAGGLSVVVGPRSALFTPFPQLGLIVVDESHDSSYYHHDRPPFYHARGAALELSKLAGAVCIFGSATPDVTSYFQAQEGRWQLLELPNRILAHQDTVKGYAKRYQQAPHYHAGEGQTQAAEMPPVEVVDMRQELKRGNRGIFSQALKDGLAQVLSKNQQAILFLNRRGTATYVFCRDCGHVMRCPRCGSPFTYHVEKREAPLHVQSASGRLHCHHCGYQRMMPETCPECGGGRIRQYGTGTERVEEEVKALFPEANVLRWDYETTRQKGAHDVILSHFSNHRADILVGTQMLAKGLDLPLVTLVGVVLADVGLHLPDFRAGERVFQVLSQVAGRAGRSPLGGQVIMQTFHPDHYVLQYAAQHDYAGFVEQELGYRKKLRYPPYAQLVRLLYQHPDEAKAESAAEQMAGQLAAWIKAEDRRATEIIGPAPAFYSRLDGRYRWQILLRGPEPASMLAGRKLGEWQVEVEPQALL